MDEVGRRQKVYSDALGGPRKQRSSNSDDSVYSTIVTLTTGAINLLSCASIRTDTSGAYQDTTMSYDGYGRLASRHEPEQVSWASTTFAYNRTTPC